MHLCDIDYCLGIELELSQEHESDIPPPPEKIYFDNQDSLEEGEITDGEEVKDKMTFSDFFSEQNIAKSMEESYDVARSKSYMENNETWSCQHTGCQLKFKSLEERNCHQKGHKKFKQFSKVHQQKKDVTQGVAIVTGIGNNGKWSCQHEKCQMKFNSLEERNCHQKVHQKFKELSKESLPPHANNKDDLDLSIREK